MNVDIPSHHATFQPHSLLALKVTSNAAFEMTFATPTTPGITGVGVQVGGIGGTAEPPVQDTVSTGRIMIVDDEISNVLIVKKHLQMAGFTSFHTTTEPSEAMAMIRENHPDVLLLDINMPEISGIDILRSIRADQTLSNMPVLILTANTAKDIKLTCLELGATDFLLKPVDPMELSPRVRNAITSKQNADRLQEHADKLESEVSRRTAQLEKSHRDAIYCLARAGEMRDNDTGNHVIRVGRYAGIIAAGMGCSDSYVDAITIAAQLHDVGKIAIPDAILLKPGKLEPEEYKTVQEHVKFGYQIIEPHTGRDADVIRQHVDAGRDMLSGSGRLMKLAASIAQTHHEKFDGSGYPLGLAGEDIPIEGRITAVADVYDALSSERPYKQAMPREKCFAILEDGRGSHFDPSALDAFFAASDEIIRVQLQFMDQTKEA